MITIASTTATVRNVASVELRMYFNRMWKSAAGTFRGMVAGPDIFQQKAYLKWPCTVSAGVATLPAITVDPTTNAAFGSDVKVTVALFDAVTGRLLATILKAGSLPSSPSSTTWADLILYQVPELPVTAIPNIPVLSSSASGPDVHLTTTPTTNVKQYKIYKDTNGGGYSLLTTVNVRSGAALSYHDTSVNASELDSYKVKASNVFGDSGYSNIVNETISITPIDPATLAFAHFNPDAITGVVDGARAPIYPDSVGGCGDGAQATSGIRAIYRATGVNGKPCLEFAVAEFYDAPNQCNIKAILIQMKSAETPFADYRGLIGGDDAGVNGGIVLIGNNASTGYSRGTNAFTSVQKNGADKTSAGVEHTYDFAPVTSWCVGYFSFSAGMLQRPKLGKVPGGAGRLWSGQSRNVWLFDTIPTTNQLIGMNIFATSDINISYDGPLLKLIYDGDSFFDGGGGTPGLAAQINTALGPQYPNVNVAVSGHGMSDTMLPNIATNIYPNVASGYPTFILATGFTNGLANNESPAAILADALTYAADAKAHGVLEVIFFTVIDRTSSLAISHSAFTTARNTLNTSLMAHDGNEFRVVDLRGHTQLEDATNTTYVADGTHPTAAGYTIMETDAVTLILSLL